MRRSEQRTEPRGGKYTPEQRMIKQLFDRPCVIHWSNGETTEGNWGKDFGTDEDYQRYKELKESGEPYPIKVDILANGKDKDIVGDATLKKSGDVVTKCLLKLYDPTITFDQGDGA